MDLDASAMAVNTTAMTTLQDNTDSTDTESDSESETEIIETEVVQDLLSHLHTHT